MSKHKAAFLRLRETRRALKAAQRNHAQAKAAAIIPLNYDAERVQRRLRIEELSQRNYARRWRGRRGAIGKNSCPKYQEALAEDLADFARRMREVLEQPSFVKKWETKTDDSN
jgi:hypothetical protein